MVFNATFTIFQLYRGGQFLLSMVNIVHVYHYKDQIQHMFLSL
jgi:hypothetical protein